MVRIYRRRKAPGRPRRLRRARRPFRLMRSIRKSNVPDIASCSVKTSIVPAGGGNYATNLMYEQINIQLAQFDRALAISKAYQFYRLAKVKLTVLFPYDTFAAAAGNPGRPNFYYMLDKSGAFPAITTLTMLKQAGARPRQCDEKPISVQWKPSVLTDEETTAGSIAAQYKLSPWISTNVPTVQHRGIYWQIEQLFPPGAGVQYECEMEVQFEFKKPLWTSAPPGAQAAIGSVPATHEQVHAFAQASLQV